MTDSGTRRFSLIAGGDVAVEDRPSEQVQPEPGLADVLTLQRQTAATASVEAERALFQDSLAEYVWARDVAGLSPRTLES
ncbi:site-specific integrase, partial [Streptomyces sp. NPDC057674]